MTRPWGAGAVPERHRAGRWRVGPPAFAASVVVAFAFVFVGVVSTAAAVVATSTSLAASGHRPDLGDRCAHDEKREH
jgi:hypothetical protein